LFCHGIYAGAKMIDEIFVFTQYLQGGVKIKFFQSDNHKNPILKLCSVFIGETKMDFIFLPKWI